MSIQSSSLRATVFPRSSALTQALFIIGGVGFIAALAQISIPIPGSPVPVTGQTLAALLIGTTYGARLGFITFSTYLLAGIAGAPIFAGSTHGIERVTGATGGYLVGMLLASFVLGYLAGQKRKMQRGAVQCHCHVPSLKSKKFLIVGATRCELFQSDLFLRQLCWHGLPSQLVHRPREPTKVAGYRARDLKGADAHQFVQW